MIESDDIENIDRSQWIPRGEPIITPERASKGDIITGNDCEECKGGKTSCKTCHGKGWYGEINAASIPVADIRFAQVQVRNILNYLWERSYISDENYNDGHVFEAWRNQHRVAMGQQRPTSTGTPPDSFGTKLRAYGYILILRRMSACDTNAVLKSIEETCDQLTRKMADRERQIYARAFNCLSMVFKPVSEQVAYLERLSEQERNELSDERLKLALDTGVFNA